MVIIIEATACNLYYLRSEGEVLDSPHTHAYVCEHEIFPRRAKWHEMSHHHELDF
jgi:hypothetical protein